MKPRVQVFLSSYNGEKYIEEQIDSVLQQKGVEVRILVRDDGSNDKTVDILEMLYKKGKINFYKGENIGYAKSFLNLLTHDNKADYYAFCDQDDFWLSNKLIEGIKKININKNMDIPILYTSALKRVDKNLNFLSLQNFENLKITLGAEFTRHRLAGCSFIFNNKLYNLLNRAYFIKDITCAHDVLATILCLATGGKVIFDKNSYILFRRHENNTSVDGQQLYRKLINEIKKVFYKNCSSSNLAKCIIVNYESEITDYNLGLLSNIAFYRESIIKTLRLAFSKEIDCGFWYYNLFIRLVILLHLF